MTIDMHSHWMPEELVDALRTRTENPRVAKGEDGREYLFSSFNPTLMPGRDSVEARIAAMDRNNVQAAVLSLTGVYSIERLPIETALPLCRIYNDAVSAACAKYPDRLYAFAALPCSDMTAMVTEFERVMDMPGIVGGLLQGDGFLSRKRAEMYRPLFEAADRRSAVFLVHYGKLPNDAEAPKPDTSDNPHARIGTLDMQARISSNMLTFCMTDFLDAFPNVSILSHNLGGNIPFEVERLDHRSLIDRPQDVLPSQRIRAAKVLVDCNSLGAKSIEMAYGVYGPGRIVYGSDGTDFGMDWTNRAIDAAQIPDSEKDAIRAGTALQALQRAGARTAIAAE
ncbi:MAG: amidohydrolase family protein [Beijerinckiaceae bacterium]